MNAIRVIATIISVVGIFIGGYLTHMIIMDCPHPGWLTPVYAVAGTVWGMVYNYIMNKE